MTKKTTSPIKTGTEILDYSFADGRFDATVWDGFKAVEITRDYSDCITALEAVSNYEFGCKFYDRNDNLYVEVIDYRQSYAHPEGDETISPVLIEYSAKEWCPDYVNEIVIYFLNELKTA